MRSHSLLSGLALMLGVAGPVAAETRLVSEDVTVAAGKPQQLGTFGHITRRCTNSPIDMRLAEKPSGGTITVKPATAKTGTLPRCPALEPKAVVVFYQSKAGFAGRDRFAIEIKGTAGEIERHEYAVTVQ